MLADGHGIKPSILSACYFVRKDVSMSSKGKAHNQMKWSTAGHANSLRMSVITGSSTKSSIIPHPRWIYGLLLPPKQRELMLMDRSGTCKWPVAMSSKNANGEWILGFKRNLESFPPAAAKILAVNIGLEVCKAHNFTKIHLYSFIGSSKYSIKE